MAGTSCHGLLHRIITPVCQLDHKTLPLHATTLICVMLPRHHATPAARWRHAPVPESTAMRHAFLVLLFITLAACASTPLPEYEPATPDPIHTSRNSLDWAGTYVGVLPCADCPGIENRLILASDGSYELHVRYLDREAEPRVTNGSFAWTYDGNHIQLDAAGDNAFFAVHEGSLLRRFADGTWPEPEQAAQMRLHRQP